MQVISIRVVFLLFFNIVSWTVGNNKFDVVKKARQEIGMAGKFKGKYRIPSARAVWWNYGNAATYFVTICTARRKCFFGDVVDGQMYLSGIGDIVKKEWLLTPSIRPQMNLTLGEFTVMPNHFHGIITIGRNQFNSRRDAMPGVSESNEIPPGRDAKPGVSESNEIPPRGDARHGVSTTANNQFGPQSKNLGSILSGFKSAVTTKARKIDDSFGWQERYHDHIIRDEKAFKRITNYIKDNVLNWKKDKFFVSKKR